MPLWAFALLLAAGIGIGRRRLLPEHLLSASGRALSLIVYALIFLIGAGMGSRADLLSNLGSIGLRSVVLALFATLGGAGLCALAGRLEMRRGS
jgi:uncharacterized membrane protein YbjE (DUF340 family)